MTSKKRVESEVGPAPEGSYCDNDGCEYEACTTVKVSCREAGDETRNLCGICEEAYTWGVQHGRFSQAKETGANPDLETVLKETAPVPMTREQAQEYLGRDGTACPFCGSSRIYANALESGSCPQQNVTCSDCGKGWTDVFELRAVVDAVTGEWYDLE